MQQIKKLKKNGSLVSEKGHEHSKGRKSNPEEVIISLNDVWKIYKMGQVNVPALRGITLNINKGDFLAVIGKSGSGKTTLMNLIGCLDLPSKGAVHLKSQDISKISESSLASLRGKTIGFIFQQYNLIPNMTALENVVLPLEFQEIPDSSAIERAKSALSLVGLSDKIFSRPAQLSGGQQQRVSIARCLVTNPDIILADEPTGALDSNTGLDVIRTLQKLWREEGKTIIMVTHDFNLASYAYRHVELKDGKVIREEVNSKMRTFSD